MPDRRQQRRQRVRQEAGGDARSVGASNRDPAKEEPSQNNAGKPQKQSGTGVAFAEPKEYESVTIMPDKESAETQKYQRREILSNWLRYEDLPPEEPEDGEDYLVGENFSAILEQQVTTGGHMMLKGETMWDDTETNILKSHGLGALHVADLVAAINTIPLQTQLNVPENALPDSVIKFYSSLAEDNRKVYQPNKGYNDCLDVNEKILQSLKLIDSEPLNLVSETSENQETMKNAVDVALSLTEAFAPEPEDVDLDLLVREPSPDKPTENKEAKSTTVRDEKVEIETSPDKEPTPVEEPSLERPTTLAMHPTLPVKEPSPVTISKMEPDQTAQLNTVKELRPSTFNFGLQKTNSSNLPMNFGLPKADTSSSIQTNTVVANALKDVDLGLPSKDEVVEGPTIDLDAPVTHTKPVLLLNKTEEEDLEDWLDSVLDD